MPNSLYSDLCDVYDEGEKPYLFISYSHEDTTKVVAAIRALQRVGYRIWYDMGISAGAQWPEDVADHIFGCEAVLAFMTPNSIRSDNCREELFYAKKLKKNILLAYLQACDLSHGMDMRLGTLQFIDRRRCKDDEEFYTRLAKAKILQPCRGEAEGEDAAISASEPIAVPEKPKTKIEELREKAANGDVQAQIDLGDAYLDGDCISRNTEKAFEWYEKAAQQGNALGLRRLGYCYCLGIGVARNYARGVDLYQQAADKGDAGAMRNLGICYANGEGVTQDKVKALQLYQEAAKHGESLAFNDLAICYQYGRGTRPDMAKALEFFQKGADAGDAVAQRNLGNCYAYGYVVAQNWDDAARWYRKAADQGFAPAQKKMAELYRKGLGVPMDKAEAERWQKLYDENPDK